VNSLALTRIGPFDSERFRHPWRCFFFSFSDTCRVEKRFSFDDTELPLRPITEWEFSLPPLRTSPYPRMLFPLSPSFFSNESLRDVLDSNISRQNLLPPPAERPSRLHNMGSPPSLCRFLKIDDASPHHTLTQFPDLFFFFGCTRVVKEGSRSAAVKPPPTFSPE